MKVIVQDRFGETLWVYSNSPKGGVMSPVETNIESGISKEIISALNEAIESARAMPLAN